MTSPKTPQELAEAIDSLVAAYVNEARRTAQAALERSFDHRTSSRSRSVKTSITQAKTKSVPPRRSAAELDELCERLHQQVCAHPGASMAMFSENMGVPVRELQRPMTKLKTEGRVRRVGERNLTRYFPAIDRRQAAP